MADNFRPLGLASPQVLPRKAEKPRLVPPSPEVVARRGAKADAVLSQIQPLSAELRAMGEAQRKAVFYRLEHERPVELSGTDLKPITAQGTNVTLAVPRSDNLDKLQQKVEDFGRGTLKQGHAPNERLVAPLTLISKGHPTDRLSDEMLRRFKELTQAAHVVYEIEMQSLLQGEKQRSEELRGIRTRLQVTFKQDDYSNQIFEHEEIRGTVRAVVRTTGRLLKRLVAEPEWQTAITWFDLRPEFETFHATLRYFDFNKLGAVTPPDEDAEIVCVVDSGVTAGNAFLAPVVREDLFHSFLRRDPKNVTDEYGHGSGVASLVAYYSLNIAVGGENYARAWIANARILDATNHVEEDRLFSAVLRQVVTKFATSGVRIFNLSVNNRLQRWSPESKRTIPRKSWVARTIDSLSREHDIVFVVSSGNLLTDEVSDLLGRAPYPQYFAEESSRLLDPAQAALAITVGSLVPATLVVNPRNADAMVLAQKDQPSPFTRSGPGINREIKPELVDYGGNYLWDSRGPHVFTDAGTGVLMASHQENPALAHDSGTSFAAPRVANKIARILQELKRIGISPVHSVLLKAVAVNSAIYPQASSFSNMKDTLTNEQWQNLVGYGMPDVDRAVFCDDYSVVMFYQGSLGKNSVAFFDVPVPSALVDAKGTRKRLSVTVVYAPQVQRWGLEEYLGTRLKWRLFRGDVAREDVVRSMASDENEEAVEVDRPGEIRCEIGFTTRSRGCVQHDYFEWMVHRPEFSSSNYTLAVASFERWGRNEADPVPYAVVVRIEELGRQVGIFAEIEQELIRLEAEAAEVET